MNKFSNFLIMILLISAVLCIVFNKNITEYFDKNLNQNSRDTQFAAQTVKTKPQKEISYSPVEIGNAVISIPVNRPAALSGKTKAEVYEIRKKFVDSSIFKNQSYEPSNEVFGQIVDRKPWISNYICHEKDGGVLPVTGVSEESRFINNPTVLIALEYPFWFHNVTNTEFCDTDLSTLIPLSITYNGNNKEITVTYRKFPFSTGDNHTFYQFNGLNAKDFGYKYVYLDKNKSTYDIEFSKESNISKDVYELYNFIHLGYACKVNGGCNNGSPRQEFTEFKNNNPGSESGKMIYLKLWKTRPATPAQTPDIVEKIVFQ